MENRQIFDSLCRIFQEIKRDKDTNKWRNEEDWLAFFDEQALSTFWWPTEEEQAEWLRNWEATPVPQRWTEPSLETPWDFESMIDAFKNGEYELISCRMISSDLARIEFNPLAYPYGGTGCIQALIESFGFLIVGEDDGTGYIKFQ
ncbi:hypothetical protein [Floridanema fluviatile]|uniref:hypothetical protein n=1 Tax=Floridanema fluviatile TaxID=3396171 RepID=UPI0039A548FF